MLSRRSRVFYGGHGDEIHCLVLSVDLEILLTGSVQGSIRLWNAVLEHLTLRVEENRGRIRALAISNNDHYFASTANDTHVRLYRTRTGQRWMTLSGKDDGSRRLSFLNIVTFKVRHMSRIVWNSLRIANGLQVEPGIIILACGMSR